MPLNKHRFMFKKSGVSLYEYSNKEEAMAHDSEKLPLMYDYYFRTTKPLKPDGKAYQLYREIIRSKGKKSIQLEGYATRSVILAFVKILQEKDGQFPKTHFLIGEHTLITCKAAIKNSRATQHGNIEMEAFPITIRAGAIHYQKNQQRRKQRVKTQYGEIQTTLDNLTGEDKRRERQLAIYLREKSRVISAFTYREFNAERNIRLPREGYVSPYYKGQPWFIYYQSFLTSLNFLRTVVEVSRRLYRTPEGDVFDYEQTTDRFKDACTSDSIPVALAQQRTSELLIRDRMRLFHAYGYSDKDNKTHRAKYGVATGSSTIRYIKNTLEKLSNINKAYIRNTVDLFKEADILNELAENTPASLLREGGSLMRQQLAIEYGGDSESSGANYSDFFDDLSDSGSASSFDTAGSDAASDTSEDEIVVELVTLPIKELFQRAVGLILSDNNEALCRILETSRANELLNYVDTQSASHSYDTCRGTVDVFKEEITSCTLLHVAIQANNPLAFNALISAGAPDTTLYRITTYKQSTAVATVEKEDGGGWRVSYGDCVEIQSDQPKTSGTSVILNESQYTKALTLEEYADYCRADAETKEAIASVAASMNRFGL